MKNNKLSPLTIERKARFAASETYLAALLTLNPQNAFKGELDAIASLSGELIGVDTPEMIQARVAMEGTAQGYRENTPELYGRSSSPMFPNGLPVMHGRGTSADCELTETETALVQTTGHNYGKRSETEETID